MTTKKKINPNTNNWPVWRIVLTGLNIIAIVLSIILSWNYFNEGAMPGCGSGSSCDQVLSSRWSSLAGIIPVSGLALGAYFAMLLASLNLVENTDLSFRRLSWSIMLMLAGTITGSAIWFTIVQKWIIESFCMYCMSTHITGLILSIIILGRVGKERETITPKKSLITPIRSTFLVLTGLIVSGVVAGVQYSSTPTAVHQKEEQQIIQPEIDYQKVPLIGSPDADHVVTLLFDYQCSHCQKIHFMLNQTVRQYDGKLAFMLNPAPLENSCNPYISANKTAFKNSCELAKIGMAVWKAKPEVFHDFENWMFSYDTGSSWKPRSLASVKAKAIELVGKEKLSNTLADPWVNQYIQNGVRMFGQTLQNGRGAIPKMIYGSKWIIPEPMNADDLVKILQESLGVPKP